MTRLPEIEYRILAVLSPGQAVSVTELVERIAKDKSPDTLVGKMAADAVGLSAIGVPDQSQVVAGATYLAQRGLVLISEEPYTEFSLTEAGVAAEDDGLPERRALEAINRADGKVALAELPQILGRPETRAEVKWLLKRGWCSRDAGTLRLTDKGHDALAQDDPDERLIHELRHNGTPQTEPELRASGIDVQLAADLLKGREDLVRRKTRTVRRLELTQAGAELKAGGIEPAPEVTQLTPELLVSGKWRDVIFKKYDTSLATAPRFPGKTHPLGRVIQETRQAFFEMGFEEVESPAVETAFWDFDALFQPQDHPAREMQDTFYMAVPEKGRLPDDRLVQAVARTHEDGGDTGSTGWRYKWSRAAAEKLVLRTHTTATTIRALAQNPNPPRKVFSIGKVFRRENVDQTHLPEFIQIDGIIIDEHASLATLMGTLAEFYLKMGAKDVRFRPSFFPYTEPSAEAFAYIEGIGWVEMCGSGVFRPEVTRPLGCNVPVIAWGGGVERVAMLRAGIDDIRKLYWADIDWLKGAPLCR